MPTTDQSRERDARFARPLVAAEVTLSLLLGFITIGSKSHWLDEAYSATVASGTWQSLYRSWRLSDTNMALCSSQPACSSCGREPTAGGFRVDR